MGKSISIRFEKDQERDRNLNEKGLKVIRIKNEEIRNDIKKVLVMIEEACGKGNDVMVEGTPFG